MRPGRTAKLARKKRADERAAARASRSVEDQLRLIAGRPGDSARERARLEKERP